MRCCALTRVSPKAYHQWKSKCAGMEVSDAKRLTALPQQLNECWATDFMSDALASGRRFRVFNVVDEPSREGLASEVAPACRRCG